MSRDQLALSLNLGIFRTDDVKLYSGQLWGLFTLETLKVSTVFTSSTPPYEFHLDNVNVNFVHNALKSLKSNKAVVLDKLSARLLKDASDVIAPILTGAINKSFTDGVFPGVWKCASHCIIQR